MSAPKKEPQQEKLLESVDARARLAGSNQMEILLFSLGTKETFGINVFKVREVTLTPRITKTPNMPDDVKGVISLRGNIIPVIALAESMSLDDAPKNTWKTMIVAEFAKRTLGFLVHDVDRIVRVGWDEIHPPQSMLANDGMITAVTEMDDGRLVSILDVEQVLVNAAGMEPIPQLAPASSRATVFFADDSTIARKEITMTLDKIGVKHLHACDGKEAWARLSAIADTSEREGRKLSDNLSLILTDAEMPEMDGYVLTKTIKNDPRFAGIPVIMHSSLSSAANISMGKAVGVDGYVAKFDPQVFADTIRPFLQ